MSLEVGGVEQLLCSGFAAMSAVSFLPSINQSKLIELTHERVSSSASGLSNSGLFSVVRDSFFVFAIFY